MTKPGEHTYSGYSYIKHLPKVLVVAIIYVIVGIFASLARPFTSSTRNHWKKKAKALNAAAVHKLGDTAKELLITIPQTKIKLHVVEAGDPKNPMIVLLHGFPDCWIAYKNIIPNLVKENYFVVAPDLRGYNLSDKPTGVENYTLEKLVEDISGLISNYKQEKAVVVGHDWGGVIAWELATTHPDQVSKLVVINGPHPRKFFLLITKNRLQQIASWYIAFIQIPFLTRNLFTHNPKWTAKTVFETHLNKNILSADDIELLASSYSQDYGMDAMLNYYKASFRTMLGSSKTAASFKKNPYRKPCPVESLVLWGEKDRALLKENAVVDDWVSNVKVHYLPKCTHWAPHESPKEVSKLILEFLGHGPTKQ